MNKKLRYVSAFRKQDLQDFSLRTFVYSKVYIFSNVEQSQGDSQNSSVLYQMYYFFNGHTQVKNSHAQHTVC